MAILGLLVAFISPVVSAYKNAIWQFVLSLAERLVKYLVSLASQPWVVVQDLLIVGVLAAILVLLWYWLQPRGSISVTLPPTPAEPEQAHG